MDGDANVGEWDKRRRKGKGKGEGEREREGRRTERERCEVGGWKRRTGTAPPHLRSGVTALTFLAAIMDVQVPTGLPGIAYRGLECLDWAGNCTSNILTCRVVN